MPLFWWHSAIAEPLQVTHSSSTSRAMEHYTVGLISDTHGVYDEVVERHLRNVKLILHAGDVGHHGGHEEVLAKLKQIAPLAAVRGNVDNGASEQELPHAQVLHLHGWKILMTHIVGHSHVPLFEKADGMWFINPGSAGPARFKLGRSVALLRLPPRCASCSQQHGPSEDDAPHDAGHCDGDAQDPGGDITSSTRRAVAQPPEEDAGSQSSGGTEGRAAASDQGPGRPDDSVPGASSSAQACCCRDPEFELVQLACKAPARVAGCAAAGRAGAGAVSGRKRKAVSGMV